MDDPRAQRTLVKSPPELWAEISDAEALTGHLGAFGDIRITRLEPETTVAWEGDRARGTVQLEPSGWGTKVTLTARIAAQPAAADPAPEAAAEPAGPEDATGELEAATEPAAGDAPGAPEAPAEDEAPSEAEDEAAAPAAPEVPAAAARPRRWWWPFGRRRAHVPLPATERAEPVTERPAPAPPAPAEPAQAQAPEPAPGPAERAQAQAAAEPATVPAPEIGAPEARGAPIDAGRAEEILTRVLDDLGAAHHRPFSRG